MFRILLTYFSACGIFSYIIITSYRYITYVASVNSGDHFINIYDMGKGLGGVAIADLTL